MTQAVCRSYLKMNSDSPWQLLNFGRMHVKQYAHWVLPAQHKSLQMQQNFMHVARHLLHATSCTTNNQLLTILMADPHIQTTFRRYRRLWLYILRSVSQLFRKQWVNSFAAVPEAAHNIVQFKS